MIEHVDSATYHDIVEGVGLQHLLRLDRALANSEGYVIEEDIQGSSYNISRPAEAYGVFEYTTAYRSNVYPGIDRTILGHDNPPQYFQTIVGALTSALVHHTNVHHLSLGNQRLAPSSEQLQAHVDGLWLSFQAPADDESEVIIYRAAEYYPVSLRLAAYGGSLSLDYVHQQSYSRLLYL